MQWILICNEYADISNEYADICNGGVVKIMTSRENKSVDIKKNWNIKLLCMYLLYFLIKPWTNLFFLSLARKFISNPRFFSPSNWKNFYICIYCRYKNEIAAPSSSNGERKRERKLGGGGGNCVGLCKAHRGHRNWMPLLQVYGKVNGICRCGTLDLVQLKEASGRDDGLFLFSLIFLMVDEGYSPGAREWHREGVIWIVFLEVNLVFCWICDRTAKTGEQLYTV